MKVDQVTRLMAQDKRTKYLADDLWRKQQDARRLKETAKAWLRKQDIPAYERFLNGLPRTLFAIRVGFHGTVALGTHAPAVAFQPNFWRVYANNFLNMYRMAFGPAFYEREVSDLVRRKNWTIARRAGLINDPYMYEEYHVSPITGSRIAGVAPKVADWANRITTMGNRGYAVLKVLRQDMFDQMWSNLPKRLQIPEVAKGIADVVNHNTGVVQAKFHPATAVALFAPKLEASRVMWLVGDPIRMGKTFVNWKNASYGDQQFALAELKTKAWVFGTMASALTINQGILKATGSNQDVNITDPFRSDFLKFKIAGMNVSYGNPLITLARLPIRLFVNIKNEGKFNKIIYEDENVYTTLGEYARTQASPFMSLLADTAIGRDWQRRPLPRAGFGLLPGKTNLPLRLRAQGIEPYSWREFWLQQSLPIPGQEAMREVWGRGMGMTDKQMEHWMKAWAIVTFMSATGGRMAEDYDVQKPILPTSY